MKSFSISKLMSLSESIGTPTYELNNAIDMYPNATMTEAATYFSIDMANYCNEINENSYDTGISLIEAAMVKDADTIDSIMEASAEGAMSAIKGFFAKIKNFIQSMIAKIKTFIDKRTMSAKQLVAKYNKDLDKNSSKWSELEFNGFKFKCDDSDNKAFRSLDKSPMEIINDELGVTIDSAASAIANAGDKTKDVEKEQMTKLESKDSAALKVSIAKKLTNGMISSDSGWVGEIKEYLYGSKDKVTIKYGEEPFVRENIVKRIENGSGYKSILDDYNKMNKTVDDDRKVIERVIEQYTNGSKDRNAEKDDRRNSSAIVSFAKKFLNKYNDAFSVITDIQGIRKSFYDAVDKQDKKMFLRLMGVKETKEEKSED